MWKGKIPPPHAHAHAHAHAARTPVRKKNPFPPPQVWATADSAAARQKRPHNPLLLLLLQLLCNTQAPLVQFQLQPADNAAKAAAASRRA